jgi:DNA-binding winged helix-turn-helix (wHTH) protein/Tol biopolymer transport system component
MSSPSRATKEVRFGRFELNVETGDLRNGLKKTLLPGQPLELLKILLERPGELVTREELIRRLWPDDTFVDFNQSLNKAVNRLRETLDDSAENPSLIETLPRKGYRFIGEVEAARSPDAALAQLPPSPELSQGAIGNAPAIVETLAVVRRHVPFTAKLAIAAMGGAVLLAIGLWSRKRQELPAVTRLTTSGAVRDLALSPGGGLLVYAFRVGSQESLRVRELATKKDSELLPAGSSFHGLTFSNDGSRVYLVRSEPSDPGFKHLYAIPVTGGEARKLVADVDSPVSFSPDGGQMVYEHCLQPKNDIDLTIAKPDGTLVRRLATLHDASGFLFQPGPAWSPDGRSVALSALTTSEDPRWILYLVSTKDGSVQRILESKGDFGRPVWTGSTALVLPHLDPESNTRQLWSVSVASGKTRPLTGDSDDYDWALSATRDTRLLATIAIHRTANVWSALTDAPADAQQTTHSGISTFDVAEMFDGKLLVMDAEGSPWTMVGDGSQWSRFAEVDHADWLTICGRYVVLVRDQPGTPELVRFDPDGSHRTRIAAGNMWAPACTADGSTLYYVTVQQPQAIWKVSTEGGVPLKLTNVLGNQVADRLAVSPDGRRLAYIYTQYGHIPSEGRHLAIISTEGGAVLLTRSVPGDIGNLHWAPSGKELQYVRPTSGDSNVWAEGVDSGRRRQLTNFTSGQIFGFNWSNDNKRLLMSRGEIATDAVLITNK